MTINTNELFKKLDNFLNKLYPNQIKKVKICCPNYKRILSTNLNLYVCCNCGMVLNELYELQNYTEFNGIIVKTYMNYSPKMRNILRIHKWINYDRIGVIINDYFKEFDDYDFNRDIIRRAKALFKRYFKDIKIRGQVKRGFICYCFYKSHLLANSPVDIDGLFKYFGITSTNYNHAVKKIDDKLFYPHNLSVYLKILKKKINKNEFITIYNKYNHKNTEFNNKTLILGLLCNYLKIENDKKQLEDFSKKFNISDNSLFLVSYYLKQNNN